MADPTAGAATACAAGMCALFVAAVGVEPQALFIASLGAMAGVTLAPPGGRWRSVSLFVVTCVAGAEFGTWGSQLWGEGLHIARNCMSFAAAALFHPIFDAVVRAIPGGVSAVVGKLKGGNQ